MQSEKLEKPKTLEKIAENLSRGASHQISAICNGVEQDSPRQLSRSWEKPSHKPSSLAQQPVDFSGIDLSSRVKRDASPPLDYRHHQQREMDLSTRKSSKPQEDFDARGHPGIIRHGMPFAGLDMTNSSSASAGAAYQRIEDRLPNYPGVQDPTKHARLPLKRSLNADAPEDYKKYRRVEQGVPKRLMANWREGGDRDEGGRQYLLIFCCATTLINT